MIFINLFIVCNILYVKETLNLKIKIDLIKQKLFTLIDEYNSQVEII